MHDSAHGAAAAGRGVLNLHYRTMRYVKKYAIVSGMSIKLSSVKATPTPAQSTDMGRVLSCGGTGSDNSANYSVSSHAVVLTEACKRNIADLPSPQHSTWPTHGCAHGSLDKRAAAAD